MAPKPSAKRPIESEITGGFDVTQVVGHVTFDGNSGMTPHEAAFNLIANFGNEGEFTFPTTDGGTCRVAVTFEPDPFQAERNNVNHRESFA